jgi:hypothetical protein
MQPDDKDRPDPPPATPAKPADLPEFPGSATDRPAETATTGEEVRAVMLGGLAGAGLGLMIGMIGGMLYHVPAGGALVGLLVGGVLGAVVVGTHLSGTGALVGALVGLLIVGFIFAPDAGDRALPVMVLLYCPVGGTLGALVGVFIAHQVRSRERD